MCYAECCYPCMMGGELLLKVHKEIIFSGFLSVKSEVIIRFVRIFEPHLLYVSFVVLQQAAAPGL